MVFNPISRIRRHSRKLGKKLDPAKIDRLGKKIYRGIKVGNRVIQEGGDIAKVIAPEFAIPISGVQSGSQRFTDAAHGVKRAIHKGHLASKKKDKKSAIEFIGAVKDAKDKIKKGGSIEKQTYM